MNDVDIAYQNASFIPDGAAYPDRWAEDAAEWRSLEAALGRARLNEPYGEGERNRLDLFLPAGRPEGLIVFVHGGFWRLFDRSYWSHFAAGGTSAGWAVAIPSYTLAPEARISQMTREIARAVDRAVSLVPRGPVVLTGHSAGGHLVSRMIMDDVPLGDDTIRRLRRIVPISPLSDLRPLMETAMNDDWRMDSAEAAAESPILGMPRADVPVSVWVGGAERPAFVDQARWLSEAWNMPLTIDPDRHHFDVIDGLKQSDSKLMREILRA